MAGSTSITLKSFTTIDGSPISMAMLGDIAFLTLEPGNGSLEEQICFTGVVQNSNGTATLSGVSNVSFESPYTQTSGLSKTHAGSTAAVLSNTSGFYNELLSKDNDETITGTYTFTNPNYPRMDTDTPAPTDNEQLVPKSYVDNVVVSGAPNANTTTKGIVQLATNAQILAKTSVGSTGAFLVPTPDNQASTLLSDYKADTGSANTYVITPSPAITAYTTGQIFSFKAANTNTSVSTININGLGTKNIFRNGSALGPGDIVSGQLYIIEYDGTQFQIVSGGTSVPTGAVQMYAASSAPNGWVLCDGSSLLRAGAYASLFAVIGTTYGSADGTHFNVPDLRGRVPVGVGTGTGGGSSGTGLPSGGSALTAVSLATWKGEETHTLTTPEIPSHNHTILSGGGATTTGSNLYQQYVTAGGTDGVTVNTGGGGAHNNIQPVMGLNFIIKT